MTQYLWEKSSCQTGSLSEHISSRMTNMHLCEIRHNKYTIRLVLHRLHNYEKGQDTQVKVFNFFFFLEHCDLLELETRILAIAVADPWGVQWARSNPLCQKNRLFTCYIFA